MNHLRLPLFAALALAVVLPLAMVPDSAQAANAATAGRLRPLTSRQLAHRLSGEVYGFIPYWLERPGTAAGLRTDLLTTVSLFDLWLTPSGSLNQAAGGYAAIGGASGTAIIRTVHAAGVRADVTLASFGFARNRAFLHSRTAERRAIAQTAALVRTRGLDGVTVDFEGVYRKDLPALGQFVASLRRAIRARNPIGRVTVAVGASQAGVAMAAAVLKDHADRVLIMGYDYRSGSSTTTGSTDPLLRRGGGMSLTWTLNLYRAAGLPMNKLILALPYYGMSWPTRSAHVGAAPAVAAYRAAPAYSITVSNVILTRHALRGYDPVEASAWLMTWNRAARVWRQTYYDSPKSLIAKFSLAKTRGLAGIGLWALGYDNGSAANWQAIATVYKPVVKHHKVVHKPASVHRVKPRKVRPAHKPTTHKVIHKPGPTAA
jgi:spore germination protein YaaH